MEIHVIRTGVLQVNTLIVPCGNAEEKKCFVVDPAGCTASSDADSVTSYLKKKGLKCIGIVLTHGHFDHITGILPIKNEFSDVKVAVHEGDAAELRGHCGIMNESLLENFGMRLLIDEVDRQPPADILLSDGHTLEVLDKNTPALAEWKIIHTPGHTPGSICLYNQTQKMLISGDTLFDNGGYGRTDMYGGDERLMTKSLAYLQNNIPSGTKVYPGHDTYVFIM